MRKKNTTTEMMKEYIADSLLILMGKKSYADISIGEITNKAGVNRSTYYRNFSSKDDIVKFFFKKIIYEYLDGIDHRKDITLKEYLQKMFTHFLGYKSELLRIYRGGVSYLILAALNESFVEVSGTFEERFKTYYHTGGIYNIFLLWFSDEMKESPESMSKLAVSTLPDNFRPMLL